LLEGWTLATTSLSRMMRELFGVVAEPWATTAADEVTYVCPPPIATPDYGDAPQPTKVITKPRRFARGTESDVYEAPQPADWQDDAPTRGRRSISRNWAVAAA